MWIKTSSNVLLNMDLAEGIAYEEYMNRTELHMLGNRTFTVSNGNTMPIITGALRCGKSYLEVNDCA